MQRTTTVFFYSFLLRGSLLLAQVDVHEAADEQHGDARPGQDVAVAKVA